MRQTKSALVNQILSFKQKDPSADTSALEKQIDKMVYKLYDPAYSTSRRPTVRLTPEEIAIVEGRR